MAASPLLGYNTNVRHLGQLYHIQTEDSGSGHAHIFTHLFADGGRIVASKKTTYEQYLGTAQYPGAVKQLMKESHKAMFIALRDGLFDEDEVAGAREMAAMVITLDPNAVAKGKPVAPKPAAPVDVDAFERAAAERLAEANAAQAPEASTSTPPGKYSGTKPAAAASSAAPRPDPNSESIFGGDLLSEKSLDEVILSYLAEDVDE